MPAYFFVDIREIKDAAKWQDYRARVGPVVEKFGGRYLLAGGPFEVVEGNWKPVCPVLVEFPSMEQARRWYDSEDYREMKALRLAVTDSDGVFLQGKPAPGA
ncbi:MAG TPA: DUF1330 domain-containing protein [Terriglobales bacterium]|nr:DUF1330 domain-containing protein [Terriglobales bacterium]